MIIASMWIFRKVFQSSQIRGEMQPTRRGSDRQAASEELPVSKRNDITETKIPTSTTDEVTEWYLIKMTFVARGALVWRRTLEGLGAGARDMSEGTQDEMIIGLETETETETDMITEIGRKETSIETGTETWTEAGRQQGVPTAQGEEIGIDERSRHHL